MSHSQPLGAPPPVTSASSTDLETGAFENLQRKIEAKLQHSSPKKQVVADGPNRNSKVKNAPRNAKAKSSAREHKKDPNGTLKAGVDPAIARSEAVQRGKKRDSNGTVVKPRTNSGNTDKPITASSPPPTALTEDDFMKELRALGGTEEDLKLFEDVESASEYESDPGTAPSAVQKKAQGQGSKDIQKGITNILKEIALAQGVSGIVDGDLDASTGDEDDDEDQGDGNTTPVVNKIEAQQIKGRGTKNLLKFSPRSDWYNEPGPEVDLESSSDGGVSDQVLKSVQFHARTLLNTENETYKKLPGTSASQYNTFIAAGTLSDKISALTLAVMESPLHNMKALESLIGLARKRNRAQAIDVLRSLKDLFAQESLLPSDRRLYNLSSQPALVASFRQVKTWRTGDKLPKRVEDRHLIMWEFEDWLKQQYFEILKLLELWCNDEIEFSKTRAVSFIYELLKEKPEQESNLLRLLVNKVGDPVKKLASQTSYLLMQLLVSHPAMKPVVISAIESDIIFKPGQSLHAKYYAAITLNQTALSDREEDIAHKLLDIYFGLFSSLLKSDTILPTVDNEGDESGAKDHKKKQDVKQNEPGAVQQAELREKLISAVLTGINRAYPFSSSDKRNFTAHLDTLFRVTHSANFNTSVQAMMLIQHLSSNHQASSDRFYRVLYESLLDPRLITASKQQLYLNLLHRSLKADLSVKRVKAFVKRILQTLALHDPSFICGVFFLIHDLEATFPGLVALIDQPEEDGDDIEVFRDMDVTMKDTDTEASQKDDTDTASRPGYDAHKRAPEHANAESACAWEVLPYLAHFHPAVALMADKVLQHDPLPGKPDLTLHTLSHFLDRFVYRNAKLSSSGLRGSSMMQPMAMNDTNAVLISVTNSGRSNPVNSEKFKRQQLAQVAAEDVFFHKYFSKMGRESQTDKSKKKQDGEAEDDEDMVWKAMQESAPDLEGDISDDDPDMSDLGSDLDEDDLSDVEDDGSEGVDIDPDIFEDSDAELPIVTDDVSGELSDFEGLSEEDSAPSKKSGSQATSKKSAQEEKRKRKALPTFASVDDYAAMLANDEDEDFA